MDSTVLYLDLRYDSAAKENDEEFSMRNGGNVIRFRFIELIEYMKIVRFGYQ